MPQILPEASMLPDLDTDGTREASRGTLPRYTPSRGIGPGRREHANASTSRPVRQLTIQVTVNRGTAAYIPRLDSGEWPQGFSKAGRVWSERAGVRRSRDQASTAM